MWSNWKNSTITTKWSIKVGNGGNSDSKYSGYTVISLFHHTHVLDPIMTQ
jgi:hypothetical protein